MSARPKDGASDAAPPAIVWFRRDLRLADNPALHAARESGAPILPVYVLDEQEAFAPGGAAKWWLHHSLEALSTGLARAGAPLVLRRGSGAEEVKRLVEETGAGAVYWNRRYASEHVEADKRLKADLAGSGVAVKTFNACLLREPWEVETKSGGPFRVYSPFWRALAALGPARAEPLPAPRKLVAPGAVPASDRLEDWALRPTQPNWAQEFTEEWRPGEAGAAASLDRFLDGPANRYASERDNPDRPGTSRLSPHLAFGEIGTVQIWAATRARMEHQGLAAKPGDKFLSEIAWREFAYHLLYYSPTLAREPLRAEFADYPWRDDPSGLAAWRRGLTGYPIVDAGMRELWRTGWMHNRVRMIVASFLIKDLLIPWQTGAEWFWDTLLDADPANNSASWQWVAGCGADAAPYFRIFNPVLQGEKFDPSGAYVRRFVPELARLPDAYIHRPWEAPALVLNEAGVALGRDYPLPIVDHAMARDRALKGYETIKKGALANAGF